MEEEEFYSRLREEIAEWQKDGIIDESQTKAILNRYKLEYRGARRNKVITVLSILGSVLVGIGVILFFASNWKTIPDFGKVALLFFTTFLIYSVGYFMRFERKNYPRVGHALLFLGSIMVGATIFLTAQIFHINADADWLVLLWFIAISPMGYAFESKPTLGLNIITFALWMALYSSQIRYLNEGIFMLFMVFGVALYGLGQVHEVIERYSGFRMVYKGFGIFVILATYFYYSIGFSYPHRSVLLKFTPQMQLLLGIFAFLSIASILANLFKREKIKSTKYEFYVLLAAFVGWAFLLVLNVFPQILFEETTRYGRTFLALSDAARTALTVIFNLFLFGISIGTISIGYYKNQTPFINAGMLFFALGVFQVYITHFHGMLPRSVSLITGGVLLLLIAFYLEKKRRVLIGALKTEGAK